MCPLHLLPRLPAQRASLYDRHPSITHRKSLPALAPTREAEGMEYVCVWGCGSRGHPSSIVVPTPSPLSFPASSPPSHFLHLHPFTEVCQFDPRTRRWGGMGVKRVLAGCRWKMRCITYRIAACWRIIITTGKR